MFYVVQDDMWGISADHLTRKDGDNINNIIIVPEHNLGPEVQEGRERLRHGGDLRDTERQHLIRILTSMRPSKSSTSAPADLSPGSCDT